MKKYLITEKQLTTLYSENTITADLLAQTLKTIEPLSTNTINRLWQDAVDYSDPIAGNSHIKLVRAIERRILGSETE